MTPFKVRSKYGELEVRYDLMLATGVMLVALFTCTWSLVKVTKENGARSRLVLEQILSNNQVQNTTSKELGSKLAQIQEQQDAVTKQQKDNEEEVQSLLKEVRNGRNN